MGAGHTEVQDRCSSTFLIDPPRFLFFAWSSQDGLTEWNKKAQEILGWSKEEVSGGHPAGLLFYRGTDVQFRELFKALPVNERKRAFLETSTKSGGSIGVWWQFTRTKGESQGSDFLFGLGLPGKDSGWLLEVLGAALESSVHMGILLDEEYQILDAFPFASFLGPYARIIGKTLDFFLPNFQAWRSLLHRIETQIWRERSFRLRCELQSPEGKIFPVLLKGVPIPFLGCYLVDIANLSAYTELEQQLKWAYDRLRFLGFRLMEAQREEREKIATELHDDFAQSLTLVLWKVKEIEKGERSRETLMATCAEVRQLLEDLSNRLRKFISTLETAPAKGVPFREALSWLVERFEKHFGIACSLTFLGDIPDLRGGRRAACLYVVREALLNVVRHAMAKQAEVLVEAKKRRLYVSVTDDGIGMSPEKLKLVRRSPGIRGMQRRARNAGGKLHITSEEGRGTKVVLTLPLERT